MTPVPAELGDRPVGRFTTMRDADLRSLGPSEVVYARVEVDETYVGGPKPGKAGRGAAGKTKVAGAVESDRGQAKGCCRGRLRLAVVAHVSARRLEGFSAKT